MEDSTSKARSSSRARSRASGSQVPVDEGLYRELDELDREELWEWFS